jgi:LAO/AO transport system kinase
VVWTRFMTSRQWVNEQVQSSGQSLRNRVQQVLAGNVRVASRLITDTQSGCETAREVLSYLYPNCGQAQLIGVTGPPGAGKSTLMAALIAGLRRRDLTVGVVAVDPSSPFSGGAVLGDRDRMEGFSGDSEVFIRSLASRGASGGLCAVANDAVDILDAMGKDVVLIETVGVGQSEIEIAQIANTVILTLVPGYGDSLQAMKAGVMEIADILVVNKADNQGADGAVNDLRSMDYHQAVPRGDEMWQVPVIKTVATRGEGVDDLLDEVFRQIEFADRTGWKEARQRERRTRQFVEVLTSGIRNDFIDSMNKDIRVTELIKKIESREIDPNAAAAEILEKFWAAYKN